MKSALLHRVALPHLHRLAVVAMTALCTATAAMAQEPAPSSSPSLQPGVQSVPVLLWHPTKPQYFVQRIASRELRPQEEIHAPSSMTLDWMVQVSPKNDASAQPQLLLARLRGLKTGTRNRYGDWVEIDTRSQDYREGAGHPRLREQTQRMLSHDVTVGFSTRGEFLVFRGAEALFESGERQEQRIEELRSMLRISTPVLPSEWRGVGTRWTYELPYVIGNWLGGHRLTLRIEAEAVSHESDVLEIKEKITLVGKEGRVASGYEFREGSSVLRFDTQRGALVERKLFLAYGEPKLGAEYEVFVSGTDSDPFPDK